MSEQSKGLPSELKDVFGVHVEIETKETAAKLLQRAKKAKTKEARDGIVPTLMAGRNPWLKRSVSRKIWPSVMEITLVGM